jgi:hypothetical protein
MHAHSPNIIRQPISIQPRAQRAQLTGMEATGAFVPFSLGTGHGEKIARNCHNWERLRRNPKGASLSLFSCLSARPGWSFMKTGFGRDRIERRLLFPKFGFGAKPVDAIPPFGAALALAFPDFISTPPDRVHHHLASLSLAAKARRTKSDTLRTAFFP